MKENLVKEIVYRKIYEIMLISSECGNLIMDLIGQDKHNEIIEFCKRG